MKRGNQHQYGLARLCQIAGNCNVFNDCQCHHEDEPRCIGNLSVSVGAEHIVKWLEANNVEYIDDLDDSPII